MSFINVSGEGEFVTLTLSVASDMSNPLEVPALQDIGVSNSNGVFRFKLLSQTSESAVLTPATNQISINVIVDEAAMFGGTGSGAVLAGLFGLSNEKTRVYFEVDMGGGTGKTISGTGFIAGLSMSVTPDQPLWTTPLTIEVDGNYTLA